MLARQLFHLVSAVFQKEQEEAPTSEGQCTEFSLALKGDIFYPHFGLLLQAKFLEFVQILTAQF